MLSSSVVARRLPALGRSASPQPLCCVYVQNQNLEFGGEEPGLHELREQLEQRLLEAQRYLTGTETAAGSGAMQRDELESRLLTCQVSPTHADRCVSLAASPTHAGRCVSLAARQFLSWPTSKHFSPFFKVL